MKTLLTIATLASALMLAACSNNDKADEQKQMNEVMTVHDKVMGYDEEAMNNKIKLDSLIKNSTSTVGEDSIRLMANNLVAADKAMSTWMEKFNAEHDGKSHEQYMAYLKDQQKQIMKIDTMLSKAVAQSKQFLAKHGKK